MDRRLCLKVEDVGHRSVMAAVCKIHLQKRTAKLDDTNFGAQSISAGQHKDILSFSIVAAQLVTDSIMTDFDYNGKHVHF